MLSQERGAAYQLDKLPYGVLLDESGKVRVRRDSRVESLIEAKEHGVASLQQSGQNNCTIADSTDMPAGTP